MNIAILKEQKQQLFIKTGMIISLYYQIKQHTLEYRYTNGLTLTMQGMHEW